jgi:hypothetical protein
LKKFIVMSNEVKQPRGLRNNNPLNIRLSKTKWLGQIKAVPTREGLEGSEKAFCVFESMAYGWRAAFRLLCHTYYGKYKLRTIRAIINRWAPPKENNTSNYIKHVAERTGISPDQELGDPATHPAQWMMLGIAMAIVECGTANLDYLSMLKGWEMAMGL